MTSIPVSNLIILPDRYFYINHRSWKLIKRPLITILTIFCLKSNFKNGKLLKTKLETVSFSMALEGLTNGYLMETVSSRFSIKSNYFHQLVKTILSQRQKFKTIKMNFCSLSKYNNCCLTAELSSSVWGTSMIV